MDGYQNRMSALALSLLVVTQSCSANGQELLGLEDNLPQVSFDVPALVVAHDISPDELSSIWPNHRLIEIVLPVSARVLRGDVHRVREMAFEVSGPDETLVNDFAPRTLLDTRGKEPVAVTHTTERTGSFDATLGGQLPIPGIDSVARVTPSVSAGRAKRDVKTQSTTLLPAQRPVIVSGTTLGGRGVFYQLRPSPQATLEGQHELRIQMLVPDCETSLDLDVTLSALGSRRVLWVDQPQVWGQKKTEVEVRCVFPAELEKDQPATANAAGIARHE